MKILVTGSTGFIGRYLMPLLIATEHQIIATSRNKEKARQFSWFDQVTYIPLSFESLDNPAFFQAIQDCSLCIHLAWDGLPDFNADEHTKSYLEEQRNFLHQLILSGVKKFMITGTCLEYGMQEGELFENSPITPNLPYAQGKHQLHQSMISWQKEHSFKLDWLRLFYMYGVGQHPKSILAQLQQHLDKGTQIFNMSQGNQTRDYLPVESIAQIIANLALQPRENGTVNCCSGTPISISQLVENYLFERKQHIQLNKGFYDYPTYEPMHFWGSTKKLTDRLTNVT